MLVLSHIDKALSSRIGILFLRCLGTTIQHVDLVFLEFFIDEGLSILPLRFIVYQAKVDEVSFLHEYAVKNAAGYFPYIIRLFPLGYCDIIALHLCYDG